MPKQSGILIGTAGVYHVASQLAACGLHAAVTFGNAPSVDILVVPTLPPKMDHRRFRCKSRPPTGRYGKGVEATRSSPIITNGTLVKNRRNCGPSRPLRPAGPSRMPRRIVPREAPVALATAAWPPRPAADASAASTSRRTRSSTTGAIAW